MTEKNAEAAAGTQAPAAEEITLEEAFTRLDELTERMEDRDLSLEESFQLYKEGMELLRISKAKIDTVEKKMLQLTEDGELQEF